MNADHSSNSNPWPQPFSEGDHVGHPSHEEDFTNFLDLDTDFAGLEGLEDGHSGLDTPMGRLGFGQYSAEVHNGAHIDMDMAQSIPMTDSMMSQVSAPVSALHSQAYQMQSQHAQMMSHHGYQVPLTPVSAEMHGAKYMQQTDHNGQPIYNQTQVSFTPLVSPAQTPLDGSFRMPEYVSSNEFFSPLSSPAIEAQHVLGSNTEPISPADLPSESSRRSQPASKRGRRKGSMSTRTPARSVKQSPAMKPQSRRRPPSVTSIPPDLLEAMNASSSAGTATKQSSGPSQTSDSSVSPEPLNDVSMPPPAMPRSSTKSPREFGALPIGLNSEPATPATLMRIPTSQIARSERSTGSKSSQDKDDPMPDIALPDSAMTPFSVGTMGRPENDGETTPTLSAKSAKLGASNTPQPTPSTPVFLSPDGLGNSKRPESRVSSRSSKKRQGTASATISPALRPKISPSITPLVPAAGGWSLQDLSADSANGVTGPGMPAISAETSALYLASKSNYQNILEGTHLPGVSYPETLAENLSSKRTSHKIAEQGRRNRINMALKEIETLLPNSILAANRKDRSGSADQESQEKAPAAAQSASKASTVEMAAIYIKQLEGELKEAKEKLAVAEQQLKEGINSDSQASE